MTRRPRSRDRRGTLDILPAVKAYVVKKSLERPFFFLRNDSAAAFHNEAPHHSFLVHTSSLSLSLSLSLFLALSLSLSVSTPPPPPPHPSGASLSTVLPIYLFPPRRQSRRRTDENLMMGKTLSYACGERGIIDRRGTRDLE